MKLIVIATTLLSTKISALPARDPNQLLNSALTNLQQNCQYPEALNNSDDYEKFFTCVYSKYAENDINAKSDEVKKVVNRLQLVVENNKNDPELRKKRFKSVLYKNAETFGLSKKQMAQYLRTSENLIENLELEDLSKFSNLKVDQIVDVSEKLVDKYLDQGQEILGNDEMLGKLGNLAMDFWGSYSKSDQGQKIVGFVEKMTEPGQELLDENGQKSLVEISKEIASSDEAKELVNEISEEFFSWW